MILLALTICLTGCQTPQLIEPNIQEFTFTAPVYPDRPAQTWYADDMYFYLSRSEAIELVNWFSALRAYCEKLDITFREIENVVNNLTDVRISIK